MRRRTPSLVGVIVTVTTTSAVAQWLNYPTPGIPRTPDGKPDLSAPAPREPDGKPDLSGIWRLGRDGAKYLANLAADFKPCEMPMQPWAQALVNERMNGAHDSEYPSVHCLPQSIPILYTVTSVGYPLKIVQEPDLLVRRCRLNWRKRIRLCEYQRIPGKRGMRRRTHEFQVR